jgi:hypothetical protein
LAPSFDNLLSAVGILVISIIVAVNGGKLAAHRELVTRVGTLRGAPAVALGTVMLAAGIAGIAFSWYAGLGLGR